MTAPLTAAALLAGKSSIAPRISDAPAALASLALDLASFFDKLRAVDNPTLESGHELLTWKEHDSLCIEFSGDDGKMIFHGIWAGGVDITNYISPYIISDAVVYLKMTNAMHNSDQQHAAANNRADIKNGK